MAAERDCKVLMVAEKPSIAKSIAVILSQSRNNIKYSGICKQCPIHEFTGPFEGRQAYFKVTSVLGHVMKTEFDKDYRNWHETKPVSSSSKLICFLDDYLFARLFYTAV